MNNWPFPPPGGPIPWTADQVRRYAQEQREAMQEAPL